LLLSLNCEIVNLRQFSGGGGQVGLMFGNDDSGITSTVRTLSLVNDKKKISHSFCYFMCVSSYLSASSMLGLSLSHEGWSISDPGVRDC
jgi:hypothetical protein